MQQFWVVGGKYKDTTFEEIAPGQEQEKLGPFKSYEEAEKTWASKAWSSVDDCYIRYEISEDLN